jgi:hypothetical protein
MYSQVGRKINCHFLLSIIDPFEGSCFFEDLIPGRNKLLHCLEVLLFEINRTVSDVCKQPKRGGKGGGAIFQNPLSKVTEFKVY